MDSGDPHFVVIYIPLCFYFIQSGSHPAFLAPFHLHSTMLLLYRIIFLHAFQSSHIYIPLCFYFICTPFTNATACAKFTFHYASTLSGTQFDPNTLYSIFTFHYASTLSSSGDNLTAFIF